MPIKLFHIQLLPIMSGVQKAMMDIITNLDKNKYKITVLCKEEGELTVLLNKWNIDFILVPNLVRQVNPIKDFLALNDITKILRREKPDIVHTHSSKSGVIGRIAASRAGVPVIFHTIHGFSFHEFSSVLAKTVFIPIERFAAKYADLHLSVNQYDMDYAVKHNIISKNKIIKLYNGIDLKKNKNPLKSADFRKNMDIPENATVVTQVGRLWKQKAPEIFVQAAIKILKEKKNIYFLLVGDGELRHNLEKIIIEHNCTNNIKILGWRTDVDQILDITDIFMLTSLWEGLSISILEAMANKLPVIATNIKGNKELVKDNETGFLCNPRDVDHFCQKLNLLINDKNRCDQMGNAGYNRVEKVFSIESNVGSLDRLYNEYVKK